MAQSERITMDPQGRLVIPARMRHALGLEPGSLVVVRLEDDALKLERQETTLARLRSRYARASGGPGIVDELLAERREEARQDDGA